MTNSSWESLRLDDHWFEVGQEGVWLLALGFAYGGVGLLGLWSGPIGTGFGG